MANDSKTLAQMIRSKYPGAYDDLSDTDLEQKILTKYPQYSDIPRTQSQGTPAVTAETPKMSARTPSVWEKISDTEVPGTGVTFGEAGDRAHKWIGMAGTEAAALFGAPAAVAAPITTAATLGSGYLAGKGARLGAEALGMGETGQNLAEDAGNIAGGFAGSKAPLPGADLSTIDLAAHIGRNETGKVRPLVNVLSRGVGAAVGHATGIPGAEVAGLFSGPSLADAFIPAREPSVAGAIPIRNSPNYDAAAYKAGRTGELPQGNDTPFAQVASKRALLSRTPAASEGRPATWTNERVLQLAAWGDPDALQQARLRGLNVKSQYSPSNGSPFVVGDK